MDIEINIPSFKAIREEAKRIKTESGKVIDRAIKDVCVRGPSQVTKAVTGAYGIKSSEVTRAGKSAKGGAKTVGKIKVSGTSLNTMQLVYSGPRLPIYYFGMTPKSRPEPGKKYTVRAAIKKSQKKKMPTGTFLAPAAGAGTTEIAFKRETKKRLPVEAIKTVAIPQMITNENVADEISTMLDELLQKRVDHYLERIKFVE